MAQLLFPDIGGSYQQGFQTGTQNRLLREGEQKQSAFSALAGQAYGATGEQRRGLIGQAVGIDPTAGLALEKGLSGSDDALTQTLVNASKLLTSAPPESRASLWQQIYPDLQRLGLEGLPSSYDATTAPTIDKTAQALVAAYGGVGGGGTVHSQKIGADGFIYNTMRDGTLVNTGVQADRQAWFRDHAGMQPEIVGKDGSITQVGQGQYSAPAPPQQHPQFTGPDGMPIAIDPSLPQHLQDQIRSNPGAFNAAPDGSSAQLPPTQAQYPQRTPAQARPSAGQEAAEVAAAKARVEMGYLPQIEEIKTDAAVDQAARIDSVKREGELTGKRETLVRDGKERVELLAKAKELLPNATGGRGGAAVDNVAGVFGYGTKGAQANTQLKILAAKLVAKVPRFEGPQSNVDVQFYREAAGDLANENLPVANRMAALELMIELDAKYADSTGSTSDAQRSNSVTPAKFSGFRILD